MGNIPPCENGPDDSAPLAYEASDADRAASAAPAEPQLTAAAPRDPYAAWRYRAFKLLSIGWLSALIGGQMQAAALGWEIYKHTGNALDLGWLALVQAIPTIVLALPAGHIADRFNRGYVVLFGQLVAAICSVAMAVTSYYVSRGYGSIFLIFIPLLVASTALTFSRAARAALLAQVVPAKVFSNTVTWNSSLFETSSMIGPALGGVAIAVSLWLSGSVFLTYVIAAVMGFIYVAMLSIIAPTCKAPAASGASERRLADGIRFVWRTKVILGTITIDLFAVLLGGVTFLLPIFADRLKLSAVGYGWLRAAPAMGAFSMAMLQAHLPPLRRAGRTMLLAVAGFGAVTIVFGLSENFWLSMAMLALTGSFDNISVVVRHTLIQLMTPDEMRGRVSAVNNVFIGASNEIGGLESGITAALFGPVLSVVGGGIGTILVVIIAAIIFPDVRRFGSLQQAAPASAGTS